MSRAFLATLTIVFVLLSPVSIAQDTIRVFFDFGRAQLTKQAKNELQAIPNQYDLYATDSIAFIGYADSVGRIDANIKLSLKRARSVRKFMKPFLDEGKITSVYAKGEDSKKSDVYARRVAMVLYYPKEEFTASTVPDVITDIDPKCFKIAMYALSYCNVTEIRKRKKKYIRLEAEKTPVIADNDYYYLKEYDDGRREAKRVKWKETETGKLWWKRRRLVAEIPYRSYERSNFFTLDTGDCVSCNLGNLIDEDTIIRYVERTIADEFLMANIRLKKRWLKRSTYKIKAPVEYIDLNRTYYSSFERNLCDFYDLQAVEWKKKRGRRRRNFYFADIRTQENLLPYITTKVTLMECHDRICNWRMYWGSCDRKRRCGNFFGDLQPAIGIQAGMVNQNDTTIGYIGTRISATNENMNYGIDLGLNTQLGLFANASADYKIMYFGRRLIGLKGSWIPPLRSKPQLSSRQYLYTGIATKLSTNRTSLSYFETNAHLGWGWESYTNKVFNRFFIEGGIARDWTGFSNTRFYPFLHAGIRLDFSLIRTPRYSNRLHR